MVVLCSLGCGELVVVMPDGGSGDGGGSGGDGGSRDGGVIVRVDLDAGDFPSGVCKDNGKRIEATPVDLMVVLDVSYSMDYDQKWVAVKSAMKSFVNSSKFSGSGIGLQYFPLRAQCSVAAYENPAVPFGVLPGAASAISMSLEQQQMSGGTPTVPVLEGTTRYARSWATQHPERQVVIVLATDGVPDDSCAATPDGGLSNSLANVLTVARGAAMASPPIKTFVIGVGKDLVALNQIAAAGATSSALLVDTRFDADLAFLDALTTVRNSALGCSFAVPFVTGVDPRLGRVRFIADDPAKSFVVPKRENLLGCASGAGAAAGWYFDGAAPDTKLVLCQPSCEALGAGFAGRLFVEFACSVE